MPKTWSIPYKRLVFAYLSMAGILAAFVLVAQGVIQFTLFRETSIRDLASTMALQELRTQATFRNSLLSILPEPYQSQMNALKVKPIDALKKNLSDIEGTNQLLIGPSTPSDTAVKIQALQSDFYNMDQAAHQVLALMKAGNAKDAAKQVAIMFPPEQRYLQGTYNAYQSLTQSADDEVTTARILEAMLCIASLALLVLEIKFVVRPALADYTEYKLQKAKEEEKPTANKSEEVSS